MRVRIALIGGSFNPPHVGHQMLWLYVRETARADRVLVAPADHHHFGKALVSFEDRMEMTRLAAAPIAGLEVTDLERVAGGTGRMLLTVEALRAQAPGAEVVLVIGADIVAELPKWHRWEDLRAEVELLVVGRQGAGGAYPVEISCVSSTEVRERIARGEDCSALVPASVLGYIAARGLYR